MLSRCFGPARKLLVAVAAFPEVEAVLRGLGSDEQPVREVWRDYKFESLTVLQTGVGKANAAGAVAAELVRAEGIRGPYEAVLALGIAGSYADLPFGSVVFADQAMLADEGVQAEGPFESLEKRGWSKTTFPVGQGEQPFFAELRAQATHVGGVATISCISGTENLARAYSSRMSPAPLTEDMETAALACVCKRFDLPFAALRVITNECGKGAWDAPLGFRKIEELVRQWGFSCIL
jgi:futalosine hydrolase